MLAVWRRTCRDHLFQPAKGGPTQRIGTPISLSPMAETKMAEAFLAALDARKRAVLAIAGAMLLSVDFCDWVIFRCCYSKEEPVHAEMAGAMRRLRSLKLIVIGLGIG